MPVPATPRHSVWAFPGEGGRTAAFLPKCGSTAGTKHGDQGENKLAPKKTNKFSHYPHKNSTEGHSHSESKKPRGQGSSHAPLLSEPGWGGHHASLKTRTARPPPFSLPVILWAWNRFQKHAGAFLTTFSPSINLRCPKSGITLKGASVPPSSFFPFLDRGTLPLSLRDLVASEMNQCHCL